MRMDAHLHSILTFAGIDPVEFIRKLADQSGYTLGYGLDVSGIVNAALPAPVFDYVSINVWSGAATLFSAGGSDVGGRVEVMRIGSNMHVTLATGDRSDESTYALLKGGPRDLRRDRPLETLREPLCGKPAWLPDGVARIEVRNSIQAAMPEAFVQIDIEIDVDIDGDARIAA